jgi:hypothetical protein
MGGWQSRLFIQDNEEIQAEVTAILAGWPRQADCTRSLTAADPFVIALARRRGFAAVASEKLSGNPEAPRIPDAYRHYGVRCITSRAPQRAQT